MIQVLTGPCRVCGEMGVLEVDPQAYNRWLAGELIQRCFPQMSADDREQLKTGIHGKCFDSLFSEDQR